MNVLLQSGGESNIGGFLISVVVVIGFPAPVFLLGRLFDKLFSSGETPDED